ncbi:PREDICTED: ATP-binding cassette sub-family G member 1-like isoform X2 [Vollenhovia emeryi]|nr:PREDICTED: ATP-binding cassette sub-family G member 1-like isoform X2 [Vollenhovia emeryi]
MSYLSKLAAMDIEFNDVTYSVNTGSKKTTMLLGGLSGQFKSGQLTAIMGPSGAGKSTLLNVLAGYKCTDIGGSISINGQLRDMQEYKKMSCYIMQESITQPNLTVFEAMSFAADLKIGKRKSKSQKRAIIDEILSILRLTKTRNAITNNLSGGEKKRLTIALELVNNPPIIFLDEPTTGLDEVSAALCVDVLQKLAHFGRTVVCSVHTPSASVFQKIDHVYIVAKGQCVYRDTVSNMVPFVQNMGLECPSHYNPADFIIEISSGEYGFDMVHQMIESVNTNLPLLPILRSKNEFKFDRKTFKISRIYQFNTLVKRMLLQLYRNRVTVYLNIWLHLFMGITIGALFFNLGNDGSKYKALYNVGFCIVCMVIFSYFPLLPVLLKFPTEIQTMKREYFNGWYDFSAYYWAIAVIGIPFQIFYTAIIISIAYFATGQPLELQRCFMFFSVCCMCAFIAESIGQNIASIFNTVNGLFTGSVLFCPLLLLAVQDISESITPVSIHRAIFTHTSYIRHGFEAITLALYGYDRKKLFCPLEEIYCHYRTPQTILKIIGMGNLDFWINMLCLFIVLLFSKGITYCFLRHRVQPNKTFQMIQFIRKLVKHYFNL